MHTLIAGALSAGRAVSRFAVTLLDAPGHKDFVPNMIAGATQADAAILVVDGTRGGFEAGFGERASGGSVASSSGGYRPSAGASVAPPGGQTREHVHVARSMGVKQLAVVVTKLDTCAYSEERFEEVKSALAPFLASCGYKAPQWLPVAAPSGENVTAPPTDARLKSWWADGPTLLGALDRFSSASRPVGARRFATVSSLYTHGSTFALHCESGLMVAKLSARAHCNRPDEAQQSAAGLPLRLIVSDLVSKASLGGKVGVGGKVAAGALAAGSSVRVISSGALATVKGLEVQGQGRDVAAVGDAVDVGLAGIEADAVHVGSCLCHPDFPVHCSRRLRVRSRAHHACCHCPASCCRRPSVWCTYYLILKLPAIRPLDLAVIAVKPPARMPDVGVCQQHDRSSAQSPRCTA